VTFRWLAAPAFAVLIAGCQTTGGGTQSPQLAPGERPSLESDEAGLWMAAERSERAVRSSGRVVTDAELNDYLEEMICRLSSEHCGQIRLHVVRTPNFNASMSPNGYMQVWTGLILRAENPDQLAFVIGHELAHYLNRHSIQRWRAIRSTSDATTVFQILTAAAGVPVVGQLGSYAALGGLMAYSRDHEREADRDGLLMMAGAGYDARQAARIWEALIAERDAEKDPERSLFFATHPSPAERVEALRELADEVAGSRTKGSDRVATRYASIRETFVAEWLDDELRKREFNANLVLLERLGVGAGIAAGVHHFYRGEVYRLRAEEGDDSRAVSAYSEAIAAGDVPVRAYRSLGLVLWRTGDEVRARGAFTTYLSRAPDADDRAIVASYLTRLGG
jgi:hypothetical protein